MQRLERSTVGTKKIGTNLGHVLANSRKIWVLKISDLYDN
jgi:hypothetical protein